MPRFAANLSMMFQEMPFLERFAAAAEAGFTGVEFLFPYEFDKAEIVRRRAEAGLAQILFNSPPGDWAAGERGSAALPQKRDLFRQQFELALDYAVALANPRIHVMAGIPAPGENSQACESCFVENLRWAGELARPRGITLLIEPLNPVDMPGYFLSSADQAAGILAAVALPHVKLQYDIYHQQMSRGAVADTLRRHFPLIGHIQVAGVPGRNEPDESQEINLPYLFGLIDELGYDGWIGCEYRPRAGTLDGLGWLKSYGIGQGKPK
ncbi:2-oxo-tetronate isomerase [Taklimakanibacter albus]|uniref:Hydroxypyruvate isomerase family protein n=1 Tax=Taklimakanibacter albus TaxID=2800327 RepID=A0ACC5R322_9HYPH|nr:2-oxo-tetronate isomerase [Aestuariivirga sp. YIM B02566]MBK1867007.1 hydroxypyruvate isomerase family protein [Aestuariivirga sp. YIM B02566]